MWSSNVSSFHNWLLFYDASRYLPLIISLKIHVYRVKKFHRVTHSLNSITNQFTSVKNFTTFFSNGNIQNYIHQLQKKCTYFSSTNNQHFVLKFGNNIHSSFFFSRGNKPIIQSKLLIYFCLHSNVEPKYLVAWNKLRL